jgi:hypothetical protein
MSTKKVIEIPNNFEQGAKNKKRDNSFFKSWKLPKIGRNRLQQPQPPQQLPSGPGVRGSRQDFRFSAGNDVTDEQGPSNAAVLVSPFAIFHLITYSKF